MAIDNKCSDKNCNHQAHIKVEYHGCDCGFFVTINIFFLLPEKVDIVLQPKETVSRNTIYKNLIFGENNYSTAVTSSTCGNLNLFLKEITY